MMIEFGQLYLSVRKALLPQEENILWDSHFQSVDHKPVASTSFRILLEMQNLEPDLDLLNKKLRGGTPQSAF